MLPSGCKHERSLLCSAAGFQKHRTVCAAEFAVSPSQLRCQDLSKNGRVRTSGNTVRCNSKEKIGKSGQNRLFLYSGN